MYGNLRAEMARREISRSDIAKAIGTTEKTVKNKMTGISGFTFFEVLIIRDTFFSDWNVEKLFSDEDEAEQGQ